MSYFFPITKRWQEMADKRAAEKNEAESDTKVGQVSRAQLSETESSSDNASSLLSDLLSNAHRYTTNANAGSDYLTAEKVANLNAALGNNIEADTPKKTESSNTKLNTAFGTGTSRANAWLSPESLHSLSRQTDAPIDTSNLSNLVGYSKDIATNTKDASEMSAEELLKSYFDKAFDTREYEGLSEAETNDIVSRLQEQAQQTEEDTMGKYAAMTGGIPSTAAVQQAAKSGSDVMSQLQDVLDSKEQEKYERYRTAQSDAYSKLSQLMSMYGYNSASGSSASSSTSSGQTSNGSLSTEFNSPTVMNQIASAAGYDTTSLPSYSSWLNNAATWLGTDTDADVSVGEIIKTADPATLMNNLEEKYPNDFIFRMAYIIDYLYDNGYLTGTEKNEWLQNSGLSAWYKIAASGNYN